MKLEEISLDEFQQFADTIPFTSFIQTKYMSHSQQERNHQSIVLGLKDHDNLQVASIVALSQLKFGIKTAQMIYGPIMKTMDQTLFMEFIQQAEKYLSKHKVVTLNISPNIEVDQFDDDFNPTRLYDDTALIAAMEKLGYHYFGKAVSDIHNNWIMTKDLTVFSNVDELFESFNKKTKNRARKAIENNIQIDVLSVDELDRFYKIEEHTSETRDFEARDLSYFQSVYKAFKPVDGVRVTVARINLKQMKKLSQEKLNQAQQEVESVKALIAGNDTPRNQKKLNAALDVYQAAEKQNDLMNEMIKKYPDEWVDAATRYYLTYGDEMLCLAGGAYLDLDFLQPTVALYVDAMNWALTQGKKRYNYYGVYTQEDVIGSVSPILHFKKGFGGNVINLIGTFEKVINPRLNTLYNSIKKVLGR